MCTVVRRLYVVFGVSYRRIQCQVSSSSTTAVVRCSETRVESTHSQYDLLSQPSQTDSPRSAFSEHQREYSVYDACMDE